MHETYKKQVMDMFGERIDDIAFALMKGDFTVSSCSVSRYRFQEEEAELELLVKGVPVTMKFKRWLPISY